MTNFFAYSAELQLVEQIGFERRAIVKSLQEYPSSCILGVKEVLN